MADFHIIISALFERNFEKFFFLFGHKEILFGHEFILIKIYTLKGDLVVETKYATAGLLRDVLVSFFFWVEIKSIWRGGIVKVFGDIESSCRFKELFFILLLYHFWLSIKSMLIKWSKLCKSSLLLLPLFTHDISVKCWLTFREYSHHLIYLFPKWHKSLVFLNLPSRLSNSFRKVCVGGSLRHNSARFQGF